MNKPTIYFERDGHWEPEKPKHPPYRVFKDSRRGYICEGQNQYAEGGSEKEAYERWRMILWMLTSH